MNQFLKSFANITESFCAFKSSSNIYFFYLSKIKLSIFHFDLIFNPKKHSSQNYLSMKLKLTLLLFIAICTTQINAQTPFSPVKQDGFGFNFGFVDFTSPAEIDTSTLRSVFKNGDLTHLGQMSPSLSVSYWKGLNKYLDFSGRVSGVFYEYLPKTTNPGNGVGAEADATLNVRPISDNHFFSPFATGGLGAAYYKKIGGYIPMGIGFQFNFQSQVYVMLQSQYRMTLSSNIIPNNLYHSFGVIANVGKPKEVAAPVEVPIPVVTDRDNDGVVDSLDRCPDTPGLAALKGCPDKDGDGIADIDDKCPDVAGLAKYQGCPIPDTDKDGINDEEDKCPNVPGVARYQGCPVPDTDKDGVNDEDDKCPTEAGPASNFGCPVIDTVVVQKVNKAAHNIFFTTGSAKLLAKSYKSLKEVAQILKDNPSFNIDVNGYTDNVGTDENNQKLSESRANSVKQYLIGNGIDAGRITATGYGETNPIADNKTAAGRAKNRRVEMKLRNY
jgi:outer membrane protein OmpA-like peptidoglycan-associated protein